MKPESFKYHKYIEVGIENTLYSIVVLTSENKFNNNNLPILRSYLYLRQLILDASKIRNFVYTI